MKNYLIYALIAVIIIGGVFVIKNKQKPKLPTQNQITNQISQSPQEKTEQKENQQINSKAVRLFEEKLYHLCQLFSKEKIEELSGKTIVTVKPESYKESDFNQYLCSYYQEEAKYGEVSKTNIAKKITIGVVVGKKQINKSQEGYKILNYTTKKETNIPFDHLLIFDQKRKFHHLDLLLTDDHKLTVETWWSLLSNEEALEFAKKFALYLKDLTQSSQSSSNEKNASPTKTTTSSNQTVPLPNSEDIINSFVYQIENNKPDQAAKIMKINDQSPNQANSELQSWTVQFSNITSFKLLKMEEANESEWTDTKHIYKVLLDVLMDPKSADALIPYYGWENGQNTRWLTLEKVGDLWKIAEIATGP